MAQKKSAGILLVSGHRLLLLKRSPHVRNPCKWGLPGGQRERGESSWRAALRETLEERGGLPFVQIVGEFIVERDNKRYVVFVARISREARRRFKPRLNAEHSRARWTKIRWCEKNRGKLHPVIAEILDTTHPRRELERLALGKRLRDRRGRTKRARVTTRAA